MLSDGRAAFQPTPAHGVQHIAQHGAAEALVVYPAVLEEIMVLSRQKGLRQARRDLIIGYENAAFLRELADQRSVPGVNSGRRGRTIVLQVAGVGHVVEQPRRIERNGKSGDRDDAEHRHADYGDPSFGGFHRF